MSSQKDSLAPSLEEAQLEEAATIRLALKMIEDARWKKVEIQTDCINIIGKILWRLENEPS